MEKEAIVEAAKDYVHTLLKEKLSSKIIYHDYRHTCETTEAAAEIAEDIGLKDDEKEVLLLAAWFHDTGFIETCDDHESASARIAKKFLEEQQYPKEKIQVVTEIILFTNLKRKPVNVLEEIMHDADLINLGTDKFFTRSELLRIEWELCLQQVYNDLEWERMQLDFLMDNHFITRFAEEKFREKQYENIIEQKERFEDAQRDEEKAEQKEQKQKDPKRGVETMFRTAYRNHINLSSIADAKANMMISINTIILSVMITIIGSGLSIAGTNFLQHVRFIPPISLLILTCLVAVIFAILSARPQVTSKDITKEKVMNHEVSALYFGNFVKMDLSEFKTSMNKLMEEKDMLYGNMITDMYYLGVVLKRKYILLRISYSVFMIGLILTVLAFLSTFLLSIDRAV